jgi:hypothetical protein
MGLGAAHGVGDHTGVRLGSTGRGKRQRQRESSINGLHFYFLL